MSRARHLVLQHLENVSRKVLQEHQEVIRDYVAGKSGIYALYGRNKLYYVGLASSLRLRLRAHLRDRHSESWDRFSLYLTEGDRHLRELEGLVIRIAMPKGNRAKTKLGFSKDLRAALRRQIWDKQKKELDSMFGQAVRRSRKSRRTGGGRSTKGQLEKIVRERLPIRMDYKGKTYRGVALPDGTVRYARKISTSLSSAAGTIAKRRTNGWYWWKYRKRSGEWVRIKELLR